MRCACLTILSSGCVEFGLDHLEDPPEQWVIVEDEFVQAPEPAVDVLFVVDSTASMSQEQAALSVAFAALAGKLDEVGIAWQAGVVEMDLLSERAGWLHGSPYVVSPSLADPAAAFTQAATVGTGSTAPEAGMAAALLALELAQDGPNRGFRRKDAALHVVFVSDADDESDAWLGGDPITPFVDALAEEAAASGRLAVASAVVGDLPSGCSTGETSALPGVRYAEAVARTGGTASSVCLADFGPALEAVGDQSVEWPRTFVLRQIPLEPLFAIEVDGVNFDQGWTYVEEPPSIVFDVAPEPSAVISVRYLVEVPS